MSELSTDDLALRAAQTRRRLQASMDEFKDRVTETLDVKRHLSQHALLISAVAALMAATMGYRFAGLFSRR
jgi:hypothetical protein